MAASAKLVLVVRATSRRRVAPIVCFGVFSFALHLALHFFPGHNFLCERQKTSKDDYTRDA